MKKTNESGRSMVEMLGVLAIIGVLSIGGIAGYTMAMNKFQSNEIVNGLNQAAVHCRTRGTIPQDIKDALTAQGLTSITCKSQATGEVNFTMPENNVNEAVRKSVCKMLGTSGSASTGTSTGSGSGSGSGTTTATNCSSYTPES